MHTEDKNKTANERRSRGVPFGLVTLLVVLALICGGALGYVGGANYSQTAKRLMAAEAEIEDYEMTLMEMYAAEFDRAAEAAADERVSAALDAGDLGVADTAEPIVVAEFDGGVVMSDEAAQAYQRELAGHALGGADVAGGADAILEAVLEDLVGEKLARIKAEEKGYAAVSDGDRAEIAARAQVQFDETVSFYVDIVRAEGMSDEDARAAAVDYLAEGEGYTLESVTADIEESWWRQKLFDEVVSGVAVRADEVSAIYSEEAAAQEARFADDPTAFEYALLNGEMILYQPAGYRTVKHLFFALSDADQARALEIYDALPLEEDAAALDALNAELDALYAPAEAQAQDAYAQLQAGADFNALMADFSDDDELGDAFADTGYYVSADSVMWSPRFVSAAMALSNPGDISEPARTEGGVHIILYVANVQSGPVPLAQVNSLLTRAALEAARLDAWHAAQHQWAAEANAVYYPERLTGE